MFGADHGANANAGVVVGRPVDNRWFPYVGIGGAWLGGFTPPDLVKPCDPAPADCSQTTSETWLFLHLRAGIGVGLGAARRHMIAVDAGGWLGRRYKTGLDAVGNKYSSTRPLRLPMAGLAYFFAF